MSPKVNGRGIDGYAVAQLFQALSTPGRVEILIHLLEGERNVSELVELTDMNQPALSKSLSALVNCGLLVRQRDGQKNFYSIAERNIEPLLLLASQLSSTTTPEQSLDESFVSAVSRIAR